MKLASRPYLFVITIFLLVLHVPAKSGKSCGNSGSFGVGSAAENGGHGKEIRTPLSSEAYMFHMGMLSCLSLVQQLTYKKRPKFGTSAAMFSCGSSRLLSGVKRTVLFSKMSARFPGLCNGRVDQVGFAPSENHPPGYLASRTRKAFVGIIYWRVVHSDNMWCECLLCRRAVGSIIAL